MAISQEVEHAAHRYENHLEALIDEAGEESFPASDPPAVHPEPRPVTTNVTTRVDPAGAPS